MLQNIPNHNLLQNVIDFRRFCGKLIFGFFLEKITKNQKKNGRYGMNDL